VGDGSVKDGFVGLWEMEGNDGSVRDGFEGLWV
jgi:hypothetical protein